MRVITGKAKGRHLYSVPGDSTRPVTDRVKEALFSILAAQVIDARFLDLFAGTGGVGIEALSRGATLATFVENNPRALSVMRRNLEITGLAQHAQVVKQDVFRFIAEYQGAGFDLIHVAPPQYRSLWMRTLEALDRSLLLSPTAQVVAQIHPKEYIPLELALLSLSDQRKYGSTLLCFYRVGTHQQSAAPYEKPGLQPDVQPPAPSGESLN